MIQMWEWINKNLKAVIIIMFDEIKKITFVCKDRNLNRGIENTKGQKKEQEKILELKYMVPEILKFNVCT